MARLIPAAGSWLAETASQAPPTSAKERHEIRHTPLKKRRRQERRFAAHVNHTMAKRPVAKAKDPGRGTAPENRQGIRNRMTVQKARVAPASRRV